jgi:sec-independent protein translocase protein TatA
MGPIGIPELIIVLVILLVIFGPKRLPGLGRSLGGGMREFKDSISGNTKDEDEERRQLEPAPTATTAAPPPAPASTEAPPRAPAATEATTTPTESEREDQSQVGEPRA